MEVNEISTSSANPSQSQGSTPTILAIDPEIRNCLPSVSPETLHLLETLILERKFEPVVYLWNGTLWDGHNVYQICQKHSLAYKIVSFKAATKEEAILQRMKRHLGRRNMSPPQILEVACRLEKTLMAEARKNQRLGAGKKALSSGSPPQTFEKKHTNERICQWTGISATTVKRFRAIRNFGDQDIIAEMMSSKLSINKAYKMVSDKITEAHRRAILAQTVSFINPPTGTWENTLWHGENLALLNRMAEEIPHHVDAFIFDPPWNVGKDYGPGSAADQLPHDVYINELMKRFSLMSRCLVAGGKVICIVEQTRIHQTDWSDHEDAMHAIDADLISGVRQLNCGLRLWDRIPYMMPVGLEALGKNPGPSPFCPRLTPRWGLVLVWAYKDFTSPESDRILPDYTAEEKKAWSITPWVFGHKRHKKHLHPGATPSTLVDRIIRLFTHRGSIICDPYNGVGTTTHICKILNRRYIGIEQNGIYCQMAQKGLDEVA